MKKTNRKRLFIIFSIFTFIALSLLDFYIIKIKKDINYSLASNKSKNKTEEMHKNFSYSDIINAIDKCSTQFFFTKIEKDATNKNYITMQLKYQGKIDELIKGIKTMKMQEITKGINEVNIKKKLDGEYIGEINVDFFKFK